LYKQQRNYQNNLLCPFSLHKERRNNLRVTVILQLNILTPQKKILQIYLMQTLQIHTAISLKDYRFHTFHVNTFCHYKNSFQITKKTPKLFLSVDEFNIIFVYILLVLYILYFCNLCPICQFD